MSRQLAIETDGMQLFEKLDSLAGINMLSRYFGSLGGKRGISKINIPVEFLQSDIKRSKLSGEEAET